jgi:putative Ca2+/H+ antiporter (TMEM165/GDT1 family)
MESVINSFILVFISEMGDKTQLLALMLLARYKKPWTILVGIFIATLLNHALASYAGAWVTQYVPANTLKWVLATLFIGFGFWLLVPDKAEDIKQENKWGALLTTIITFFFAEMGDKTQLATVALGAKYAAPGLVTWGSTLGMLASNGLTLLLGNKIMKRISMLWIHRLASALFILFGVAILIGF